MKTAAIAEETLFGERNGERIQITIAIGAPYLFGPNEWACPITIEGLQFEGMEVGERDIHAASALQSLCLAARFAYNILGYFNEDGGTLHHDDGTAFDLDATFGRTQSV